MKKLVIASALALTTFAASAADFGLNMSRSFKPGADNNGLGVSVGQQFGKWNLTGKYEWVNMSTTHQDRWSLVGGYDVAKFGSVTVAPKLGVAYLDNKVNRDGYAVVFGVGASMPLTKDLSATFDVLRQEGQDRVKAFNSNTFSVGLKHSF